MVKCALFYVSTIREVGVGFILQNVLLHDIMHELVLVLKWQDVDMFIVSNTAG